MIEKIATELSSIYTGNLLYAAGANAFIIIDYIIVMKTETNYTNHYGNDTIGALCRFSKFHNNRPFKEVSRNDIINFLDSLRKTGLDLIFWSILNHNHSIVFYCKYDKQKPTEEMQSELE